jgi:drug/metabolite transporter (DMT)-like permease
MSLGTQVVIKRISLSIISKIHQSELTGIYYMLEASFLFALTGLCVRVLKEDIGPIQSVFFRNSIGFIYIAISLYISKPTIVGGNKLLLLVFRGIIGTLALYSFFYGVTHIGLGVATTYQQTYPIFLAVMSVYIFHENLSKTEWLGVFIGFLGVAIVFLPQLLVADLNPKSHIIGLSNAIMTGLAYLSIRGLKDDYDVRVIVLVFMICGIILPLLSMMGKPFFPSERLDFIFEGFVLPKSHNYFWILLMGFAALGGQICLTKAFLFNKTGLVGAIGYSNILFAVTFGWLIGDPNPKSNVIFGIVIIIISGLLISGVFSKMNYKSLIRSKETDV